MRNRLKISNRASKAPISHCLFPFYIRVLNWTSVLTFRYKRLLSHAKQSFCHCNQLIYSPLNLFRIFFANTRATNEQQKCQIRTFFTLNSASNLVKNSICCMRFLRLHTGRTAECSRSSPHSRPEHRFPNASACP